MLVPSQLKDVFWIRRSIPTFVLMRTEPTLDAASNRESGAEKRPPKQ